MQNRMEDWFWPFPGLDQWKTISQVLVGKVSLVFRERKRGETKSDLLYVHVRYRLLNGPLWSLSSICEIMKSALWGGTQVKPFYKYITSSLVF